MNEYSTGGDPQAMRSAAATLRNKAGLVAEIASQITTRVGAMTYAGPAATRFRAATSDNELRLRRVVATLEDAAYTLDRAAAQAELDRFETQPRYDGGY